MSITEPPESESEPGTIKDTPGGLSDTAKSAEYLRIQLHMKVQEQTGLPVSEILNVQESLETHSLPEGSRIECSEDLNSNEVDNVTLKQRSMFYSCASAVGNFVRNNKVFSVCTTGVVVLASYLYFLVPVLHSPHASTAVWQAVEIADPIVLASAIILAGIAFLTRPRKAER